MRVSRGAWGLRKCCGRILAKHLDLANGSVDIPRLRELPSAAMRFIYPLLILVPIAIALQLMHAPEAWIFLCSAFAIVPLAGVLGRATEEISVHTAPTVGGLLNATLGNAAELIITLFALQRGLVTLVKASLIGSILGNLLLVLGIALVAGGVRHRVLVFNPRAAGAAASMLILSVISMVLPALFSGTHPSQMGADTLALSVAVAGILILIYILSLIFSLVTHKRMFASGEVAEENEKPNWTVRRSLLVLLLSTAGVAWMAEILVGTTEHAMKDLHVSELFLGVIVIPVIGNAAEHASAVWMATKNKTDLALGIAIGSSTQVALFVAPVLVFAGLILGKPMDFVFSRVEVIAIALATAITTIITLDGESNWFEGAQLLAVYLILAVTFYFY
jgi:Ca2+:H+ antiporter